MNLVLEPQDTILINHAHMRFCVLRTECKNGYVCRVHLFSNERVKAVLPAVLVNCRYLFSPTKSKLFLINCLKVNCGCHKLEKNAACNVKKWKNELKSSYNNKYRSLVYCMEWLFVSRLRKYHFVAALILGQFARPFQSLQVIAACLLLVPCCLVLFFEGATKKVF